MTGRRIGPDRFLMDGEADKIVKLRDVHGLTFKLIAQRLSLNDGTVSGAYYTRKAELGEAPPAKRMQRYE